MMKPISNTICRTGLLKLMLTLLLVSWLPSGLKGQFTNEFRIGEYAEFYSSDSIKVYFNCSGKICRQSCASFYRTGTIDRNRINVTGRFRDYYMNDTVALEAVMDSGYLQGKAVYFYENGQIKCSGNYSRGTRTGLWKFYYASGTPKQVINYFDGFPFVAAYFNEKGRPLVINGEGKYEGQFRTYRSCEDMEYKGIVREGVLDGKVRIYSYLYKGMLGYEYYEQGRFLKGVSGSYNYDDSPKIELPGYNVHEQFIMDENTIYCPGFLGTSLMQYDNEVYWTFYNMLLDSIHRNIKYMVEDQWLAIGIGVDYTDKLYDVSVFSSKDDYRLEKDLFDILIGMKEWESAQVYWRKVNTDLFFTILITRGRVVIPAEIMKQKGIY